VGWARLRFAPGLGPLQSQEQGTELKNTAWGTTWENWNLPLTAGSQGTLVNYFLVPQFPHRTSCEVPVRISESLVQGKHSVNIAIQAHPAWF
jgi:hypothetical protein